MPWKYTSSRIFSSFWTETKKVTTCIYVGSLKKRKISNGATERINTASQAKDIFLVCPPSSCNLVSILYWGKLFTVSVSLYRFQLLHLALCAGHSALQDLIIITIQSVLIHDLNVNYSRASESRVQVFLFGTSSWVIVVRNELFVAGG